jgi:hypothetical protein
MYSLQHYLRLATVAFLLLLTCGVALADDQTWPETQLFWGDTHLHTSFSADASMNGNTLIGPAEAYRLAQGEAVKSHSGAAAQLSRPLDFLVIADHAEYLGILPRIRSRDPELMRNDVARRWAELILSDKQDDNWRAMFEVLEEIETNNPSITDKTITRSAWEESITIADQYNAPGKFTAFIGFEWTSMPEGNNLHRVVVFRDDANEARTVLPFSSFDSEDPEDLWQFMADYESRTGGSVLAIPHNGNLSNGQMFATTDFAGVPIDSDYAELRSRWEPLYEVTQIKGDGETHPALSSDDRFADFGTWDHGNLTSTVAKQPHMLKYEYARSALGMGLMLGERTGINPFQFGMIGSTDAHTGFAAVAEGNFWGKFSVYEPGLLRLTHRPITKGKLGKAYDLWAYEMVASGYAAVWATENTREALFDAMRRREVYATTGPRIRLRFFGGWNFDDDDADRRNLAEIGYSEGVPMGGILGPAPGGKPPTFLLRAMKDPEGVDLSILQIVKGWIDRDGDTNETIFDVIVAEDGESTVAAFWRDPSFDFSLPAFYYVRVLEVEKPRWSTIEAERLGVEFEGHVPRLIRDRVYSSPIWYVPPRRVAANKSGSPSN